MAAAFATLDYIRIGNRMIESMPYSRRIGRFRTSDTLLAPRYRADPRLDYASLSATTIPDNETYMCVCSIGRAGGDEVRMIRMPCLHTIEYF